MRPQETETTADILILTASGKPLAIYDDGMGPLWIYRESLGIVGIVRAATFEDAYDIVQDEFMAEADEPTWEAIAKEISADLNHDLIDSAVFQEGYGFRPNGANVRDKHMHGIYQRDLNGEALDLLTPALLKMFSLTIVPAPAPASALR